MCKRFTPYQIYATWERIRLNTDTSLWNLIYRARNTGKFKFKFRNANKVTIVSSIFIKLQARTMRPHLAEGFVSKTAITAIYA